LFYPLHAAEFSAHFRHGTEGVDRDALLRQAKRLLEEQPRTRSELGKLLFAETLAGRRQERRSLLSPVDCNPPERSGLIRSQMRLGTGLITFGALSIPIFQMSGVLKGQPRRRPLASPRP
jgi:hypothetical protein